MGRPRDDANALCILTARMFQLKGKGILVINSTDIAVCTRGRGRSLWTWRGTQENRPMMKYERRDQ